MALYSASFYPDNIGNGEYDGKGTYSIHGLTTGEKYSNNKNDLARRMKIVGKNCIFGRYPVILDITERERKVMRFRLTAIPHKWERLY